jgi:hypothetical protein
MSYRYRGRIYTDLELTNELGLVLTNNNAQINHTGTDSLNINSNGQINIGTTGNGPIYIGSGDNEIYINGHSITDSSITGPLTITGSLNTHIYGAVDGGSTFLPVVVDSSGYIITQSLIKDASGNNITSTVNGGSRGLDVNIITPINFSATGLATETTANNSYLSLQTINDSITGSNFLLDTVNNNLTIINDGITGSNLRLDTANTNLTLINDGITGSNLRLDTVNNNLTIINDGITGTNLRLDTANTNLTLINDGITGTNFLLDTVNNNLTTINDGITGSNLRLDTTNNNLTLINDSITGTNLRLDTANTNLTLINDSITGTNLQLDTANSNLTIINASITGTNLRLDTTNNNLTTINSSITGINIRLDTTNNNLTLINASITGTNDKLDIITTILNSIEASITSTSSGSVSITGPLSITGSVVSHIYGAENGGSTFLPVVVDSSGYIIVQSLVKDASGNNITSTVNGGSRGLDVNMITPINLSLTGLSVAVDLTGLATETTATNSYNTLLLINSSITGTNLLLDTANTNLTTINASITGTNLLLDTSNTNLTTINDSITGTNFRMDTANTNLTTINDSITGTNFRMDTANTNLTIINNSITGTNFLLDTTNTNLTTINASITGTNLRLDTANNNLTTINASITGTNLRLDTANTNLTTINASITGTNLRLDTANTNLTTINASITGTNNTLTNIQTSLSATTFTSSITGSVRSNIYGAVNGGSTFLPVIVDTSGYIVSQSLTKDASGNNITSTVNGASIGLDVNINNGSTTNTTISGYTGLGLNMYQILPKMKNYAMVGSNNYALADAILAGQGCTFTVSSYAWGKANANKSFWLYTPPTGNVRTISYNYINASGDEITATATGITNAYVALQTNIVGVNNFTITGNVQLTATDGLYITLANTGTVTLSVASMRDVRFYNNNAIFTVPNNAIAMITNIDAIIGTANDFFYMNVWDANGNRTTPWVGTMFQNTTINVSNYRAGSGEYGCIGRVLLAGETVAFTSLQTTSTNKNVIANIKVIYF